MMRIAGRDSNGLAKPINVDSNGNTKVTVESFDSYISITNAATTQTESYTLNVKSIKHIMNLSDILLWVSIDNGNWIPVNPRSSIFNDASVKIGTVKIRSEYGIAPFEIKGVA
jgi:hypothetical protein